jgi:hypothetical protein
MRTAAAIGAALLLAACSRSPITLEQASAPVRGAVAGDIALARDPDSGDLLAAWVARGDSSWHIHFARSPDAGRSWSEPSLVTPEKNDASPPHGESSPRLVALRGGRIAIFWSRDVPAPGRQWPGSEMRVARSLDAGREWQAPQTLNSDSADAPGTHTFFGATALDDGTLVAAWLDERGAAQLQGHHHPLPDTSHEPTSEADARIFAATSRDFGEHWGTDAGIWGAVCPCCRVSLAPAPDGRVVAAWRQHFPGNIRDIVTGTLMPASAPVRVSHDDWEYPGCPHTGPALAVDSMGTEHVVWYTGKPGKAGIFYSRQESGAAPSAPLGLAVASTLATAHASVALTGKGGVLAAYDMSPGGQRMIQLAHIDSAGRLAGTMPVPESVEGRYPQIVVLNDSTAALAWNQGDGIRLVRVRLGGY